jgi:predicted GIY-YIG superfamily endonuclease
MDTLYVLQLEDNKWYVGKSADVAKRFEQHKKGSGSAWTKEYAPIRIAETRKITSPFDETNVTKEYMNKYGIDNVRGGAYTAVTLPDEQETLIRHELRASSDTCYKCGQKGHFANRCDAEVVYVYTCGDCDREFKTRAQAEACRCSSKPPSPPRNYNRSQWNPKTGSCYRCGRSGHWANSCYARTDIDGNDLDNGNDYDSE